ncbi:MAG: DUF4301 family protein, partial [Acidobacteriota bacterium]
MTELSRNDQEQIRAHGLGIEDVEHQLAFFRQPPPPARLVRACTVGDGIVRLDGDRQNALEGRYA